MMSAVRDDIKAVLTKAFHSVDKDGNGWIDASEIRAVITNYYQSNKKPHDAAKIDEDTNQFFATVDRDDDKKVTLDEFLHYFLGHFTQ